MRNLGGLWKKMPLTFLLGLIGVLGIAGIPLFNGYASKTLLFEGIVEASHKNGLLLIAEMMFLLTSGGTIAYYLKMITLTFFGKPKAASEKAGHAPVLMLLPMSIISGLIVAIGVYPNLVLEKLVYPILRTYTFDHHAAEHILQTHFFTIHGLQEVALVSLIGVAAFTIGWKKNLLFIEIPRPYGPDYWYERIGRGLVWLAKGPFTTLDSFIDERYIKTGESVLKATKSAESIEHKIDHTYTKTGEDFAKVTEAKPWVGHHVEKSEMVAENFLVYGDYVASFDQERVDGVVNQAGISTLLVSSNTAGFDLRVVDGIVDGIADELHKYGDVFRRIVTGIVNDYTGGIIAGAIMIWVLIVLGVR